MMPMKPEYSDWADELDAVGTEAFVQAVDSIPERMERAKFAIMMKAVRHAEMKFWRTFFRGGGGE